MSGEQFLEKYQNMNWMYLMENNEVRRFVLPKKDAIISGYDFGYSLRIFIVLDVER